MTASAAHVLVLGAHQPPRGLLAEGRDSEELGLELEPVESVGHAIDRMKRQEIAVILCRVDGPEETAQVLRLRIASPETPVIALTSGRNPALDDLVLESGADYVESADGETGGFLSDGSGPLRALIECARDGRPRGLGTDPNGREVSASQRLRVARSRILAPERAGEVRKAFDGFAPLLVEDDATQAELVRRAFQKAVFPFPLSPLRSGDRAIDYLAGAGDYADRERHPLPSLLLLDLHLPGKSGLEVLEWTRSRPELARLPVYILSSALEQFDQCLALGANDCYPKPYAFKDLVDISRSIAIRWWFLLQAHRALPG